MNVTPTTTSVGDVCIGATYYGLQLRHARCDKSVPGFCSVGQPCLVRTDRADLQSRQSQSLSDTVWGWILRNILTMAYSQPYVEVTVLQAMASASIVIAVCDGS